MGIGAQRINLAVMLASSRVIALAAALEHDQVLAEPGLVPVVAEREPAAESLAIGQAAARARVIVRGAVLGLAIVRAEALVLAIVLAEALVLIIAPAEVQAPVIALAEVQAPVIALAEVREPETVQVEAAPVRSHLRARLAVPLRTKSVIAVHHRGRVPLLAAAEDLAAVVETTRDPAATEAGIAWAAAVTVVAVVAPE
jgi:hypothetical protein